MEDLLKLNSWLKEANCILYAIRGNHDDPKYFNGCFMFSHLKLLPDYTVLNIDGKKVLFVGGAHSIDRGRRIRDNDVWFPDEVFNLDEDKLIKMREIEVVITHTAPNFAWPMDFNQIVYNAAAEDGTLLDDLRTERAELTKMFELLEMNNAITHYIYGHFHQDQVTEFRGTEFRCLGIESVFEIKSNNYYENL